MKDRELMNSGEVDQSVRSTTQNGTDNLDGGVPIPTVYMPNIKNYLEHGRYQKLVSKYTEKALEIYGTLTIWKSSYKGPLAHGSIIYDGPITRELISALSDNIEQIYKDEHTTLKLVGLTKDGVVVRYVYESD